MLLARRQMAVVPTKLQDKRLQSFTPGMWLHLNHIEEGKKQARRQNVVAADLGDIVQSLAALDIFHQDDFEKRDE